MKTLELANYGVQEMNVEEMKEIDGGGFWETMWIIACTVVTVLLVAAAVIAI